MNERKKIIEELKIEIAENLLNTELKDNENSKEIYDGMIKTIEKNIKDNVVCDLGLLYKLLCLIRNLK